MDDYLKMAMEMVKAQAGVRAMSVEDMVAMAMELSKKLAGLSCAAPVAQAEAAAPTADGKKSIRETTITCCECGKAFKLLTKKHLASHGLTQAEYKAKHGIKKTAGLSCKKLARDRRKRMSEMKLWERRGAGKAAGAVAKPKAAPKKKAAAKKAPKAAAKAE